MSQIVWSRFRENCDGFFEQHKWLIVLFALALSCDSISTVYFMYETGPGTELHPGVKYSSIIFGTVAGPLIAGTIKAAGGIAVSIYLRKYAFYILFTTAVLSFWAAWYNIWGYSIYTPYLLQWLTGH